MTDAAGTALLDQVVMEAWWPGVLAVVSENDIVQTAEGSCVEPSCSTPDANPVLAVESENDIVQAAEGSCVEPSCSTPDATPEVDGWSSCFMMLPLLASGLSRREVERLFKEVPGRPSLASVLFAITSSPAWYSVMSMVCASVVVSL